MPFEKTGPCPFEGSHWPPQWGEKAVTPKRFHLLNSNQQTDLFEYFYEHESAKTSEKSQPPYRFPLIRLKTYFGGDENNLKKTVTSSEGYKAFAEERRRSQAQPPPPEMSLLTSARITACLAAEPPAEGQKARMARGAARDREAKTRASADQVVRRADRAKNGISFSDGLPRNDGRFTKGEEKKGLNDLDFEKDPSRSMVCCMQKLIEEAADRHTGMGGTFTTRQRGIFDGLVAEEQRKDEEKRVPVRKDARAPYKARAALGLILLLSSILWYVSAANSTQNQLMLRQLLSSTLRCKLTAL